jgi:hypothetical protein
VTLIHELKNSPTSDWHFLHWPMADRLSPSSSSGAGAGDGSTSIALALLLVMSEAMREGGSEKNRNQKVRRSGASVWLQVASAASLVIRPPRDLQLLGTGEASDGYEEGNNGLI